MYRGSAVTDQNVAYFTSSHSNKVYHYTISTDEWLTLPPCPYSNSALVIIDNELTAVGGGCGGYCTNKLVTLRQGRWVEEYPRMCSRHSRATCVGISNVHHMKFIRMSLLLEGGVKVVGVLQLNY